MNINERSETTPSADLSLLCDEYSTILYECSIDEFSANNLDDEQIVGKLITVSEWEPDSAKALVKIAKQYGFFFLRNATSLAIAMGIEDGVS